MDHAKFYIVSTPIGNLSDMSLRGIEILKNVDLILSEDTRETAKILRKFEITVPQISYRDQNHARVYPQILDTLSNGKSVALVSDSGTPLISDPGFKLVNLLIEKNFDVISIPGPSAVISALVSSGLPTDKFSFLGFLPKSDNQRKKVLSSYGQLDGTLVIYESPFRINKLLKNIKDALGNRKVCIMSELTKIHESRDCDLVENLISKYTDKKIKGEYVVLVAKENF